jgi:hypothetical protein
MSNARFNESVVEQAALDWLSAIGYTHLHGLISGELRIPGAEQIIEGVA